MRAGRGSHGDDFVLAEDLVARYFDHVEPPSPDEGPLTVVGEDPTHSRAARRPGHLR